MKNIQAGPDTNTDKVSLIFVNENPELVKWIEEDQKLTKEIMEYHTVTGGVKQSAHILFDYLHISPIVCNLSFSVNGTAHQSDKSSDLSGTTDTIVNFFLESIGATITEFKDVKFSFGFFGRVNALKTWDELYNELFEHYKTQSLRQVYVLIFGLDVLGNPFGLVSDFSEGFTSLFYEPLIGYLAKPEDINEDDLHFGRKIKGTVDRTISSAAGSASLITGSVGRVLATCSFDKEYKRVGIFILSFYYGFLLEIFNL